MKTGIAIFAYNRDDHLQKVLDGLAENKEVKKIYCFQDGLRTEADRYGWERTREVIEKIDWCECIRYYSLENKGLSASLVEGINDVLKENDAIIVLEDDCVPQKTFVHFMQQCFEKYENNNNVLAVSGYSWPFIDSDIEDDIYFCGRPCPWGWGTWKDRWEKYEQDYNIIKTIKNDQQCSERLAIWGADLEDMLGSNIRGITDSWYVFLALQAIRDDKVCINPSKSLIDNIGFDGTGVHCTETNVFDVTTHADQEVFELPQQTFINDVVKRAFAKFYGDEIVCYENTDLEKILVYGVGGFCRKNLCNILNGKKVVAYIDSNRKDRYYAGYPLIRPQDISLYDYDKIFIMISNVKICNDIRSSLIHQYNIKKEILLGPELI